MKKIITLIIVIILVALGWSLLGENTTEAPVVEERQETTHMHEEGDSHTHLDEDVAGTYTVNTQQTVLNWEGAKITGSSHAGTIPVKSSTIEIGEESVGEIIFDMANVTSDSQGLTDHLLNEDFFNVAVYPEARFAITEITEESIIGELTIKDQTQRLSIPISISETGTGLTVKGNTVLDRTEFDITYGSGSFFQNLGDRAINDAVPVSFTLVLDKQ